MPTVAGFHDFVGFAVFQDAVLMDAGFVGESVFADNCLVALYDQTGEIADHPAGGEDFGRIDVGADLVMVAARGAGP